MMKSFLFTLLVFVPGLALANTPLTCEVNSKVVNLEIYTIENSDIAAYRYLGKTDAGAFVSIVYVVGAYDMFAELRGNDFQITRAPFLNVNLLLSGEALKVTCPEVGF